MNLYLFSLVEYLKIRNKLFSINEKKLILFQINENLKSLNKTNYY